MDRLCSFRDVKTIKGNEIVGAAIWNPLARAIQGAHSNSGMLSAYIDPAGRLAFDLDEGLLPNTDTGTVPIYNSSPTGTIHQGDPVVVALTTTNGASNAYSYTDNNQARLLQASPPILALEDISPQSYGRAVVKGLATVRLEDTTYSQGGYIYRKLGGEFGNCWAQSYAGPHKIIALDGDTAVVEVNARPEFRWEIVTNGVPHLIGFSSDMSGISCLGMGVGVLSQDTATGLMSWVSRGTGSQSWTWADLFPTLGNTHTFLRLTNPSGTTYTLGSGSVYMHNYVLCILLTQTRVGTLYGVDLIYGNEHNYVNKDKIETT